MDAQSNFWAKPEDAEKKYTAKIEAPIYEPKNKCPHTLLLCCDNKVKRLVEEIDESGLPEAEKTFLKLAANRHAVFNYEKIADYYSHASPEMQMLMEKSALVIIDFDSAIERGYVRLCETIRNQFIEEYPQ